MFRVLLLVTSVVSCLAGVSAAIAQELKVTVPWAPFAGRYELAPDGTLSGYYADLTRLIAEEAGLEVSYREYPRVYDAMRSLALGETDMRAGVAALPVLGESLLSDPIAEAGVYLFVRDDPDVTLSVDQLDGQSIGVVSSVAQTPRVVAESGAEVRVFEDAYGAFGALVTGRLDGVVTSLKQATDLLRRTRLDYRVQISGAALEQPQIYVAVAPGRADLLPPINAAIARLKASGALDRLLARWNVIRPATVPNVLRVGVSQFPPYQIVTETGEFTGYGVEALRDLARLTGLTLEFLPLTTEEWAVGPAQDTYDMLPPLSITDEKRVIMDFTIPIQQSPYSIFMRQGEAEATGVTGLEDLVGKRVGVSVNNWALQVAQRQDGLDLVIYDTPEAMLSSLLEGEVTAVLYATQTMQRLAEAEDVSAKIEAVQPPFTQSERAIALRPGLATIRENLNAVIPGYLSSEAYQNLHNRWLSPPSFWTSQRVRLAQLAGVALLALIALAFVVLILRGRAVALDHARRMESVSNRYGAILNTARSGILALNRDGRIDTANPGAVRMLRLSDQNWPAPWPAAIRFLDPYDLSPLEASSDPVRRALSGAVLKGEKAVLTTSDEAEPIHVHVSSSPVNDPSQPELSSVLVLEDITEQETVRRLAERSSRLDALGQLTGGVAHDFNNILGTIEYATELAMQKTDDEGRKYLRTSLGSVRRGAELTSRLLAFAKKQPGKRRSVALMSVFGDLRQLVEPVLERSVGLRFATLSPGLQVCCDPSQLENALLNLCLNSRDAIIQSGRSGQISVSVAITDELGINGRPLVAVSVVDDGPGMPPEVRERATDPFFTTKSANKGTGLGLAMVYGFADQSDGRMEVVSAVGEGCRVTLYLPMGETSEEVPAQANETQVRNGEGETILIVEDQPDLLDMLSEVLRALGYQVVSAPSGREAVVLLEQGIHFDLLLTDIVMPGGVGGYQLAEHMRGLGITQPIVYMSGYSGIGKDSYHSVPGEVLAKPCSPSELSEVLRRALG
jgi:signal transduction histidine kinase